MSITKSKIKGEDFFLIVFFLTLSFIGLIMKKTDYMIFSGILLISFILIKGLFYEG